MYVYDEANNLAKALQESKEYKEYKKAKEEIEAIPEMKAKIEEFLDGWNEVMNIHNYIITETRGKKNE